jgi:hypothetical protein
MSRWMVTILFLFGSAILNHWIPFSSFFRNVDTMVHEFGHAVMTLLLSGEVLSISLFADHSGVTYSYITGDWRLIPVSAAGYLTGAVFTVFLFYCYSARKQRLGLAVLTGIAVVSLLFFIRNGFGVVWTIGFIAVNAIAFLFPASWLRSFYYLLVAFVSLEESVAGPIGLILLSLDRPDQAGDAAGLYEATGIPSVFWAIFFTLFSLWCAKSSIGHFLGGRRSRSRLGSRSRKPVVYIPDRTD